jgi:hypothetical protein
VLLARALGLYILGYALYSLFGDKLSRKLAMPRWVVHVVAAVGGLVATIFGGLAGAIYADVPRRARALERRLSRHDVRDAARARALALRRLCGDRRVQAEDVVLILASIVPVAIGTVGATSFTIAWTLPRSAARWACS